MQAKCEMKSSADASLNQSVTELRKMTHGLHTFCSSTMETLADAEARASEGQTDQELVDKLEALQASADHRSKASKSAKKRFEALLN